MANVSAKEETAACCDSLRLDRSSSRAIVWVIVDALNGALEVCAGLVTITESATTLE